MADFAKPASCFWGHLFLVQSNCALYIVRKVPKKVSLDLCSWQKINLALLKKTVLLSTLRKAQFTPLSNLSVLFVNFFVLTCSLSYYRNKKIILYVKMNGIKSNATIKSNDGKKFESRCTPIQFWPFIVLEINCILFWSKISRIDLSLNFLNDLRVCFRQKWMRQKIVKIGRQKFEKML